MGARALVLALVVAAVSPVPADARSLEPLDVRRAVLDVDRGEMVLELRCRASHAACAGVLRATTYDGAPVTVGRRVQLHRRRTRRVALSLLPGGFDRLATSLSLPDRFIGVALETGRGQLVGEAVTGLRASCRSGQALAESAEVRAFRIKGFGVYACRPPAGRPGLVAAEDISFVLQLVTAVQVAGPYVGYTTRGGWKCSEAGIALYDVRTRRQVRSAASGSTYESTANGCTSATDIARFVLRPSGALAWTEEAGDSGVVPVRVLDAGGVRLLDSGRDVDPTSLRAIDDRRIGWLRGGTQQEAALS